MGTFFEFKVLSHVFFPFSTVILSFLAAQSSMNKFDALMSTKASDCFPVTSMSTYIIPLGLVLLILNEAEDP